MRNSKHTVEPSEAYVWPLQNRVRTPKRRIWSHVGAHRLAIAGKGVTSSSVFLRYLIHPQHPRQLNPALTFRSNSVAVPTNYTSSEEERMGTNLMIGCELNQK